MNENIAVFKVKQLEKLVSEHEELFGQKGKKILNEFISIFESKGVDQVQMDRIISGTMTFAHQNTHRIGQPITTLIVELKDIAKRRNTNTQKGGAIHE